MQKVSSSSYRLPILFCLIFLALSNLNSSHFDPFTKFSFRISRLAFKGNFPSVQRSSLELCNIKKMLQICLVHFHLETSDQCRDSRDIGISSTWGEKRQAIDVYRVAFSVSSLSLLVTKWGSSSW